MDPKLPPTRQARRGRANACHLPIENTPSHPPTLSGYIIWGCSKGEGRERLGGSSPRVISKASEHSLSHCIWGSGGRARVRRFPSRFFVGLRLSTCSGWTRWPGDESRSHRHVRHREPRPPSHRSRWRSLCVGTDRASTHELRQSPNQTQLACGLVSCHACGEDAARMSLSISSNGISTIPTCQAPVSDPVFVP